MTVTDAENGPQQTNCSAERGEAAIHRRINPGHGGGRRAELVRARQAVPLGKPPGPRQVNAGGADRDTT